MCYYIVVCKPYEVMCTNGTATTLLHANITYTDTFKVIYSYANITCHQGYAVPDENIQIQCLPTAENNDTYWNRYGSV